jgi:hypothetical protein
MQNSGNPKLDDVATKGVRREEGVHSPDGFYNRFSRHQLEEALIRLLSSVWNILKCGKEEPKSSVRVAVVSSGS